MIDRHTLLLLFALIFGIILIPAKLILLSHGQVFSIQLIGRMITIVGVVIANKVLTPGSVTLTEFKKILVYFGDSAYVPIVFLFGAYQSYQKTGDYDVVTL